MSTFGTLRHAPGEWTVEAVPHVVLKLKRVFPKVARKAHGPIALTDTIENSRELEWFCSRYPLEMDAVTKARLTDRASAHRDQETLLSDLLEGRREPRVFDLALPPREYQRVAADMCLANGGMLCADDLGLGKTAVGICVISDPAARPALVVTLTHLPRQWEAEIKKFAPGLTTHVLKKGRPYDIRIGKKRAKGGQLALSPDMGPELPDVIITSYSKLTGWAEHLAPLIRGVVYDEVQELRHAGSGKAQAAAHISASAHVRLGLSATPIYNHGNEIFHVLDVLRPGALGSNPEFIEEWCTAPDQHGRARVVNPAALGTHLRAAGLMLRRTRAEVGRELPDLQVVPHHIECDAGVLAEAEDAASQLAKIILGTTGASFEERGQAARELDWRVRQATGIAKAPFVAEFVRMLVESGERVVLFGWHREVYGLWLERLSDYAPAIYTGTESANQKDEARRRFVEGETPVLIMSLRSGAGLDGLQHHARTVVFGELDWSPGVHDQCAGRLHRDGQSEPVVAYYLMADSGSDPIVADVLGVKATQAKGIRDPNAPLVQAMGHDGQHAKRLAQAYLERTTRRSRDKQEDSAA